MKVVFSTLILQTLLAGVDSPLMQTFKRTPYIFTLVQKVKIDYTIFLILYSEPLMFLATSTMLDFSGKKYDIFILRLPA